MSRLVKHLGARSCPTDASKVLIALPYFPGEVLKGARISAYFASGDASAIDQPGECNWYGITVPWSLVFATRMMDAGDTPSALVGVAEVDALYSQWLRQADSSDDDTEFFGGDVDADPESESGEEGHDEAELLDHGPIGVQKWFSREVVLAPFAAEGNTVIRFGDSFNLSRGAIPTAGKMGGLLLFGMVRFEAAAETNFNVELDDAVSREAMGLLIGGDYSKISSMIEGNTASLGDYIRTVLFGGDNYIEADTLKGPAGKAVVKASFYIESAISRKR